MNNNYIFIVICLMALFSELHIDNRLEANEKQDTLTDYLSELISMNTLSTDLDENKKALHWVEDQLKGLPLHFKHYQFGGHSSLMITTQDSKKTKVWLVAHMDVVFGKPELFRPILKDNKLYGRGAYDMKMAIAAYILMLQELKDQLKDLDFGIMLTTDEEIGGANGVKLLLKEGYSSDIALLPDGGFDWKIEEAAKGILQIALKAKGVSAHGSRPWNGENAINKLMLALQEINAYFDKEKVKYGDYYPTVNVGTFEGGKSTNQVPEQAEAKLDIRYPPSVDPEKIMEDISNILKKHKDISLVKNLEGSSHKQNLQLAYFEKFRAIAKKLYGIEVGSSLSHGASDARFFGERQIPIIVVAPKGGEIHSDKEWVDMEDMTRFYEVMKAWVLEVAR